MYDPKTAIALQQAMRAAQSGDMAAARRTAQMALVAGGDIVALNAFLGMLAARSGDPASAVGHLKAAHAARPGDVTIACNLIAALIDIGDLEAALDIASADRAKADASLRIARYRGYVAQTLERFAEAVDAYRQVVDRAPNDFESWNNLGNALVAIDDFDNSIAALRRAVALDPAAAPTRINLAAAFRAAGRTEEAEQTLRQAAADFPADARPLNELYVQLRADNRDLPALEAIQAAVARDPANANLQLKFAIECGLADRMDDAEQAYKTAIAIDPALSDAYLGLAIQYEHTNRERELVSLIALAERNGLNTGPLSFIRALELRREQQFETGLAMLDNVPDDVEPVRTAHLRATFLDRLGRTDEAFSWFERTAELHQADESRPLERAAASRQKLSGDIALLSTEWVASWAPVRVADAHADPVFLVGFPRSGTTLLDTILMGHPDTVVMEEAPPLNLVDQAMGGMAALPDLTDEDVIRLRAQYFAEVEKIGSWQAGKMLIDKSPLFLHKLPQIVRLFPNARFILALRHPCDVLLSCFMSNFKLNDAMSNFLRLDDAAAFYNLTFQLWEKARSLLPASVYTIVYEQLVDDVAGNVRPLFDSLGLDWHEEALDHRATAQARGMIPTASYSQVTEPIYKRAAGRWQRYRAHLEPALPQLEPWVRAFGYTI